MKITLFVIAVASVFIGCTTISEEAEKQQFGSADQVQDFVYYYIEWEDVPDTEDTVSTAEETLARGKGSCYDQCTVFIYLCKKNGIEAQLYPVVMENGSGHMLVESKSLIYDPTNYRRYFALPSGWAKTTIN